jgi:thioredoxin-like negative regulator of GroEL
MQLLSSEEFKSFVEAKPAAAVHFDAEWDSRYRPVVHRRMLDAEEALADQVNFGEVHCESNPELAKSVPILNVPSVAYYRNGTLIAALIGAEQNVRARLERVLRGESIGYKDGLGGPAHLDASTPQLGPD